jgi:hypothetical protein
MASDIDPRTVAARLSTLRSLYVPETVEEARKRLRRERPPLNETLEQRVAQNLAELRALYELARSLRRDG